MRELKINKPANSQDTLHTNNTKQPEQPQQDTLQKPKLFYQGAQTDSTSIAKKDTIAQQPVAPPPFTDLDIKASVGKNGVNNPEDVAKIGSKLKELGIYCDSCDLDEAIMDFQKYALKRTTPDGRIDPGGPTLARLKATDAAGYESMKKEYQQQEEQKKNASAKSKLDDKKKEEDAAKLEQMKNEADKSAKLLIAKYTSYGNLDEEGLGKELAHMTVNKPYVVYRVLDFLGSTDRDDVSYEIVRNMYAKELLAANKVLLRRMYDELDAGWTTEEEYDQMKLLKLALGINEEEKTSKPTEPVADPFNGKAPLTSGWLRKSGKKHGAFDYGVPEGTKVPSPAVGKVVLTSMSPSDHMKENYGNFVVINHGVIQSGDYQGMTLYSLYGHLSAISIESGTDVSTGTILGLSGNTGSSTGPHLHWEIFASKTNSSKLATGVSKSGATNFPNISKTLIPPNEFIDLIKLAKQ